MTRRRPESAPAGEPPRAAAERVALERMAHGGEAVGRAADGRAAFVAGGLPGESVDVAFVADRPRFRRGFAAGAPSPRSPDRVEPRCAHFGGWPARGAAPAAWCGGCHWQHAAIDAQRAFKRATLVDALQRLAGLPAPDVDATVGGPSSYGYRNKLRTRLRGGRPGLVAASGGDVVALDACPICLPRLWAEVAAFEAELPDGTEVTFRVGAGTGDALVVVDDRRGLVGEIDIDSDASVVVVAPDRTLQLAAGRPFYVERFRGEWIGVPATAFFQVNTEVAELVADAVAAALGPGAGRVVDACCGIGTLTGAIADVAAEVVAVDIDAVAIAAAVDNLAGRDHVDLVVGDAAEALAAVGDGADAVVVDPPRGGLSTALGSWLAQAGPPRVVYVSCEPATLARDVRALIEAGYRHHRTTPFDMFPQTYHCESVTVLARPGAALA